MEVMDREPGAGKRTDKCLGDLKERLETMNDNTIGGFLGGRTEIKYPIEPIISEYYKRELLDGKPGLEANNYFAT